MKTSGPERSDDGSLRVRRTVSRGIALFLLMAGSACGGEGADPDTGASVMDSAGVTVVESRAPAGEWSVDPEPLLSVGQPEGERVYLLSRVADAALLPDGGLAILDGGSVELRTFAPDGVFRGRFGGRGDGPGEFRAVAAPLQVLDSGDLLLWDPQARRVTRVSEGLELLGTLTPRPVEGTTGSLVRGHFPDGSLLVQEVRSAPPRSGFTRDTLRLHRADPSGRPVHPLGTVEGGGGQILIDGGPDPATIRSIQILRTPMDVQAHTAVWDTLVMMATGNRLQVSVRDSGGTLRRIHRILGARTPLGATERQAFIEMQAEGSPSPADTRAFYEDVVFPDSLPAFDRMVADEGGGLWLRAYQPPFAAGDALWHALDAEGRWVADVRLPGRLEVTRVTSDRVVGIFRDDLDVESVRVFSLERGG